MICIKSINQQINKLINIHKTMVVCYLQHNTILINQLALQRDYKWIINLWNVLIKKKLNAYFLSIYAHLIFKMLNMHRPPTWFSLSILDFQCAYLIFIKHTWFSLSILGFQDAYLIYRSMLDFQYFPKAYLIF